MRKVRVIENCRCYHLISRLAHRAFFLDDEEKTLAVELLRRVEEIGDDEILRRINVLYRGASLSQVLGEWKRLDWWGLSPAGIRDCPQRQFWALTDRGT